MDERVMLNRATMSTGFGVTLFETMTDVVQNRSMRT